MLSRRSVGTRQTVRILLGFAMACSLCGCRLTPGRRAATPGGDEAEERAAGMGSGLSRGRAPRAALLDEDPILVNEVVPETTPQVEDRSALFDRRAVAPVAARQVAEYPESLIKGIHDPDEKIAVMFDLDAAPLTEIVPLFAGLLNFSYLIDPTVKGAVTMTVDSEMTAREAWEMFEHILWLAGAYASKNPGFIHIMPFAKMPQERRLLATHDPMANVEVAFVPIMHVKSAEILGLIKPFMTDGATVTDLPNSNTLLIIEAPANMPKLREFIARLDDKGEAAWPHICLRCNAVDAEQLRQELEALLPVLGFPVTNKGPSGGQIKLVAIPRLQVLIVSAALNEVLEEVRNWFSVLDREDIAETENIFFYNVRHGTAAQLSEVLSVFFNTSATMSGRASTTRSTSAKAAPTGSGTSSPGSQPAAPARSTATTASRKTEGEGGLGESIFDTPVIVYVDEVQNRLTIRTTHRAFALVKALLQRQDVPLRQVMIEAAIAEIRLTKSTEFGFAYAATHQYNDYVMKHAAVHTEAFNVAGEVLEPRAIAGGTALSLVKDVNKMAFLRAVAGEGNVRILSAPQILATTDQEAHINVGAKVPVITGDYSDTSSTVSRRSYQYQNTGTILTVTPHVTAGNEVQLDIRQEVSAAVQTEVGVEETPTILNKELETSLVIPDGGTVMMGGLIDTETSDTHSGVPWLKDAPVLGRLFRTNVKSSRRTEILVLITVNVVENISVMDALVARYASALQEIREQLNK